MAEKTQPKLPLPRLLVTSPPAKQPKKRKSVAEKAATKRALEKARAKTRVNIGAAFEQWRQLRDAKGLRSDAEVAFFLLGSYQKNSVTSPAHEQQVQPLQPIVSSFTEEAKRLQQDGAERKTTCVEWHQDSYEEIEVTVDADDCNSVKNRLADSNSDMENTAETTEQSFCEEDVSIQRPMKSELLQECKEEEPDPSQKHTSQVHIKEEEEDVGEFSLEVSRLSNGDQADCKAEPSSPQSCSAILHTPTPEAFTALCTPVSSKPVFLSSHQSHERDIKTEF